MANYFKAKPKKSKSTDEFNLTIERIDTNGQGVGFYNKKPIFVSGALPEELVRVHLTEQKSKFSKAKLLDVLVPSKDRAVVKCAHFQQCGGCDLQHLSVPAQLTFKQNKLIELFSRQKITQNLPWQAPIEGQEWQYRRKARIGVQYNKKGQATIGFRRQASNQLQVIKTCVVLVEPLNNIFTVLNDALGELTQSRSIGHVEVINSQVNVGESLTTLVLRQLKPISTQDSAIWQTFENQHGWQILLDDGDSIKPLTKLKTLSFKVNSSISLNFNSDDFIQVNAEINQKMVEQAINWINPLSEDVVLDLFCGLGNFTLPLARHVKQVVGVEGVLNMVIRAQQNADLNNIENVEFFQADLNNPWLENSWVNKKYTKAILDPARAGALVAVEQLIQLNISEILYVSCDPTTLAIDSKKLIEAGYKISKIGLMDMFTHTKHSETMVLFSR